ncbi:hypothetical protein BGX27_007157 [Mortierella sp. AM989]|nr:hypothetical protein BGX27_007157 [Mortierella sp. AM989]
MHRSFILPPSIGSQQQQKRKKWPPLPTKPSVNAKATSHEEESNSNSNAQEQRMSMQEMAGVDPNNIRNYNNRARQSLKHKLDDDSREICQPKPHRHIGDSASNTATSSRDHTSMSSESLSLANFTVHGSTFAPRGSMAPPSMAKQIVPNIGSPRSLSDRRKMTASQLSRRFVIGTNSASVLSSQSTQRYSQLPNQPTHVDTIPSQSTQTRAFDLTKTRKSSEFAKRMVLPSAEASATNIKGKKKTKFTPPLVSGGYAERLMNAMTYHRSEYTMWANATLRQDKLFGSTEPLAIVEVMDISRDRNLQWARCNVIFNENNKAPFNVSPERVRQYDGSYAGDFQLQRTDSDEGHGVSGLARGGIVMSTPSQDLHESMRDELDEPNIEEEDSIYGLHKDMFSMGVLVSSQGSIFDGSSSQQHPSTYFEPTLKVINEERDDSASSLRFLKSSQGSDDGAEEPESSFGRRKETAQKAQSNQDIVRMVDLTCIKDSTQSDDISTTDEIDADEATVPSGDTGVSVSSSASSTPGAKQPATAMPLSTKASKNSALQGNGDLRPSFWIVFSNLFNWSRLKVADKVEIHEPCRKIMIPDSGAHERSTTVWIVERYKVISI